MEQRVPAKVTLRQVRKRMRWQYSAEEKVRLILKGLLGTETIAELCQKEGINQTLFYLWRKEFLEAGKKQLQGDTRREATSDDVTALRKENARLKELVAEAEHHGQDRVERGRWIPRLPRLAR